MKFVAVNVLAIQLVKVFMPVVSLVAPYKLKWQGLVTIEEVFLMEEICGHGINFISVKNADFWMHTKIL